MAQKILTIQPRYLAFTSLTAARRYLRRDVSFGAQHRMHRRDPDLDPAVAIARSELELGRTLVAEARRGSRGLIDDLKPEIASRLVPGQS